MTCTTCLDTRKVREIDPGGEYVYETCTDCLPPFAWLVTEAGVGASPARVLTRHRSEGDARSQALAKRLQFMRRGHTLEQARYFIRVERAADFVRDGGKL